VPEVLFVCTHNAGRSQLARALLSHHAGAALHVRSAGTQPVRHVDPTVLEVLREPLTDDVVRASDVVVTAGCGDACAVYPGKRYLDWELEDPEGKSLPRVRAIRDQVDELVQQLLLDLGIRPVLQQTDSREGTS
jgi:protein-tyrosine-phosphatase